VSVRTVQDRAARGEGRGARQRWASFLPSVLMGVALLVGYFLAPLSARWTTHTALWLAGGLLAVGFLVAWQVRAIRTSPMPLARAVGTLTVSVPLFLIVFAVTYFLMGRSDPGAWTESLTRLDALYFTLTVFATVGFGDITASSQVARAVVTLQMAGDLVVVGVIARVVVHAVREGLARRPPDRDDEE